MVSYPIHVGPSGGGEFPTHCLRRVPPAGIEPGPQRSLFFASLSTTKGASHAKFHRTAIELFEDLKFGGVDRDKTPGPVE